MPFSYKQSEYLQKATHRWNIKTGATRSGKTYLDYAFVIPKRIEKTTGNGLILLLGNTQGTLERNVLEPMRSIWGGSLVSQIHGNTLHIFGKRCYALGADRITQVSKLQGAGVEYCYGDEVATWDEKVFQMLKSRLDKPTSVFDGTANPDAPSHWFKRFLDSNADIFLQEYTIDDNPFLSSTFVENLKREYAGTVYYDRFILGRWVAAEGVIYKAIANNPKDFIIYEKPNDLIFGTIGVDFGGNGSATAFNFTGYSRGFDRVVTLKDYYRREIISPLDLEDDFVKFVKDCYKEFNLTITDAYCDSAEQTLIKGLRNRALREGFGFNIRNARKGKINERIRFFCRLQASRRHKIMSGCTKTLEAFRTAVFDTKKINDERLDNGVYNIDSLDAQEYAVEPYMQDIITTW